MKLLLHGAAPPQAKNRLALILAGLCLTTCCARASAPNAEASVPVLVDGRLVGAALVRGGVAYLPLRSVAKALHLTVGYNADAQMIIVTTPQDGPHPTRPSSMQ